MNNTWNPISLETITNPFPHYQRIRSSDPVLKTQYGDWLISTFRESRKILSNHEFNTGNRLVWINKTVDSAKQKGYDWEPLSKAVKSFLILLNPPDHTLLRNFLISIWPDNNHLKNLSNHIALKTVSELDLDQFNVVSDFAQKISGGVISQLLGLPPKDLPELIPEGINILRSMDPYLTVREIQEVNESCSKLVMYFNDFIEDESTDRDTIISKLKKFDQDKSISFSPTSLAIFLFVAGIETTATLICNYINYWFNQPVMQRLIGKFSLNDLMEEVVRMEPSVHLLGRYNAKDIELMGQKIPAGSTLTINIGAANRDPDYFGEPDVFNPARKPSGNLSFSAGAHHCLGNQLAFIETESAFRALQPLLGKLEQKEDIQWSNHLTIRNMDSFILGLK